MRNGDLIICGVEIRHIDLDAMNYSAFNNFYGKIWEAVDAKYGAGNGLETESDIFDEDYQQKLKVTRQRVSIENQADREAERMKQPLVIDNKTYVKIAKASVMYIGWECDGEVWIVKDDQGSMHVATTNHGKPELTDREFLLNRIAEYERVKNETQGLLNLLSKE